MVYFVSPFRVPLLLCILMASSSSGNIKGNLSDARIISSFLEKIIKPYKESNQIIDEKPRMRANIKTNEDLLNDIENAIRLKVIQLEPMLQDNDNTRKMIETENKIKTQERTETDDETDDETTIIEFVPEKKWRTNVKSGLRETKQDMEKNIEKFKKLRQNITLMLDKEKTSTLTNKLITKTLDEILSLLIQGQCKWKSEDTRDLMNQLLKHTSKSMENLTDKELNQYKLTCYMRRRDKDSKPGYNDDPGYSGYGLIKSRTFGRENYIGNKNQCHSFIVCSDELRRFLKLTYKHLNDTAVSTFTNYAAMYIRDIKQKTAFVNDDITTVLVNSSKSAETAVYQVFLNELEYFFTLDTNKNKAANIEHINNFITATTGQIKSNLSRLVDDKMSALEIKFIKTIRDDLKVNLRMEMDNFSHQFADKICKFFSLCNGINTHETKQINKLPAFRTKDPEDVYVKVRVSFDDELKDSLRRYGEQNLNSWQRGKRLLDANDRRKYSNVNVTRTTIRSTATTNAIVSSENGIIDQFF